MATFKQRDSQLGNWLVENGLQSKGRNANIENRKANRGKGNLKTQLDAAIKNRPKYNIAEEAYANQGLAKSRAFGRDRSIQMAEENVDRDVASSIGSAKNISSNTGAILDTLSSIGTSAMDTKRGLAMNEAQLQNQKFGELYGANNAMIDEKDKAWNYNVNQPYMNKIQALRDNRKFRQELLMKGLDFAGTIAGATIGGPAGSASGGKLGSVVPEHDYSGYES